MQQTAAFFGQLYELTLSEMKARYRKTLAGLIWVLLSPSLFSVFRPLLSKGYSKLQIETITSTY